MSAPASAPSPTPATPAGARPRVTVGVRLLAAVAFVVVGFAAIWQGFGLAGFGTDVHFTRIVTAWIPLLAFGLVFLQPRWIAARVLLAVIGLGVAGWLWWIAESSNLKSAVSLRDAVSRRDEYKATAAQATIEDWEKHAAAREIGHLFEQWPSLMAELKDDYERWTAGVADDIVSRYDRASVDDIQAVVALRKSAALFIERHASSKDRIEGAQRQWLARAVKAKTNRLTDPQPAHMFGTDWALFERTAPDRHALATTFPETRSVLVNAEDEWAMLEVRGRVTMIRLNPPDLPIRVKCGDCLNDLLALKPLDPSDGRFREARKWLFSQAHHYAQTEVTIHLEAKRYELAYGLARKHAVEWNATATMLGPDELKKLDTLRDTCAALDKLASKAAKPPDPTDIAPEPRPKEK